jgi:nucleoid-associated protein YgaU
LPPLTAAEYASRLRSKAELLNYIVTWHEGRVDEVTNVVAGELPADLNWDVATQWYLALVALERSRLDFRGGEPPTAVKQVGGQAARAQTFIISRAKSDASTQQPAGFHPARRLAVAAGLSPRVPAAARRRRHALWNVARVLARATATAL